MINVPITKTITAVEVLKYTDSMIWLIRDKKVPKKRCSPLDFCKINIFLLLFYFPVLSPAQEKRYEYTENHMGSPFRIVFYAENDELAGRASRAVFDRIRQLNTIMSDYLDGSEINRLSQQSGARRAVPVSPELFAIISQSVTISRNTGGCFDITLGPVIRLWRNAMLTRKFPDTVEIKKALKKTGYKKVKQDKGTQAIRLTKNGMRLELGAIGKGYAADECIAGLRSMGITSALADAGGDLALAGPPPGRRGWKIDVTSGDPRDSVRVLELAHAGIATSGATYRYLDHGGKRYSHIVDPKTGLGLTNPLRSTVIAATGSEADALSTAFAVADPAARTRILANYPSVRVWLFEMGKTSGQSWSHGF